MITSKTDIIEYIIVVVLESNFNACHLSNEALILYSSVVVGESLVKVVPKISENVFHNLLDFLCEYKHFDCY